MRSYDFTRQAERMILDLPLRIRQRIIQKIEFYLSQPNPLSHAKHIVAAGPNTFRFQVGDYRVIFDWEGDSVLITKVGHRKDIYRS